MDLQGGPTFEDLSIDDELTQLQRLVRYSSSSIALQRLVHVKMLAETVAAVGFDQTVKSVVPLLGPLAEDHELVVRQHLGEQLEEIARFCRLQGQEAGYRLIIEIVLPTLAKLLGDPQAEVRQAAGESLVGVANLMKPIDLGHHVLTIVLQLAHDDEQEELRMTAAALLNDLAEALGNDLCKQFVTPEMESLSEDPVFRVRKATALNLDKIISVVGEAGITRLLPAYIRLTKDDVYRVRKACTEALVEMSKAVGAEVSLRELTPVFLNLASDSSKLVRTGALQHLGRLISTLPGESVSEDLVRYFTGTAVESMGDPVADAELRLYCAFSFPAVVITIGRDRWHELRESFACLIRDPSWSVRKTLSFSLHEIAKVLKPDDVERDLIPAMEAFLRDMEDVRLGVIRQLADFFREMTSEQREKHLNVLVEILQTTSPFNWRLREVLAQQLPRLAPLLTPDSVFFAVVPVAFGLLNDPVAVVREKTFEVVAPLLQLAGAHSGARQASMVSRVRELAHAHTYQARQMYVYICHSMACSADNQERPLFVQEFVPSLAELAEDSVVNVRIAMSRALSKCPDWVMEIPDIRRAIHRLGKDSNPDVRHFLSFLPPILGSDFFQEEKQHPGQETSSVLSDESVLTQWSVSTQRSMLSVGDFHAVGNTSSPNSARSIKLGRQRSSSVESVGESGYSTTSEEGEGLKRLTLRRPPLPSGWGLPAVSSAEPPPNGNGDGGDGDNGAAPAAAEAKADAGDSSIVIGGNESGSPADFGWGVGATGDGGGLAGEDVKGAAAEAREDQQQGGAVVSSEADALIFGLQAAAAGTAGARDEAVGDRAAQPLTPPYPKRAVSQDAAVMSDDEAEAETGTETGTETETAGAAGVMVAEDAGGGDDGNKDEDEEDEDASTAALSAKIADLTLAVDAASLAGANPDGMLPPTPLPVPPPDIRGVAPPLATAAAVSAAVARGGEALEVPIGFGDAVGVAGGGELPSRRLNLTPPPWEGNERRDAAVVSAVYPPQLEVAQSLPSGEEKPPAPSSAQAPEAEEEEGGAGRLGLPKLGETSRVAVAGEEEAAEDSSISPEDPLEVGCGSRSGLSTDRVMLNVRSGFEMDAEEGGGGKEDGEQETEEACVPAAQMDAPGKNDEDGVGDGPPAAAAAAAAGADSVGGLAFVPAEEGAAPAAATATISSPAAASVADPVMDPAAPAEAEANTLASSPGAASGGGSGDGGTELPGAATTPSAEGEEGKAEGEGLGAAGTEPLRPERDPGVVEHKPEEPRAEGVQEERDEGDEAGRAWSKE